MLMYSRGSYLGWMPRWHYTGLGSRRKCSMGYTSSSPTTDQRPDFLWYLLQFLQCICARTRFLIAIIAGGYVCSASSDRTIGLWSVHDFKRLNRLNGHWEEVSCLANVGQELWSGSLDGSVRIWSKVSKLLIYLQERCLSLLLRNGLVEGCLR